MSKRAEATWVVLGFCCLAVAATYPLVLRLANHLPSDLGDPLLTAWTLAWDADRFRHGLARLWDAPNFFPYPHTLLYSDHLLGIAIFTAPLQWATANPVLVYNVAFLASFVLSGGGMYVLVRELTGRRDAALVAGLIYACQPFRALHLSHLQWQMTGWLPLSLWALHRYFVSRRLRDLMAATIFYLLQALTASYFTYFALVPVVVIGLMELWRTRVPLPLLAKQLVPAVLLLACVLAPIARAYYAVRVQSGLKRTSDEIRMQSADVAGYFSPPPNVLVWSGRSSIRGEREVFPGVLVLVLAAAAIGVRTERRVVGVYATVLLAGFVLSLGPEPMAWGHRLPIPGLYGWLLRIVPGLDGLRVPARLAVVVQVALAVLAAIGYTRLADRVSPRVRAIGLVLVILVVFAEGWTGPIDTPAFGADGLDVERDAYRYLRSLPAGPAMEVPTSVEDPAPEFKYQYMTIVHRHPVVNGHSGYVSPLVTWLGGGHSPLREPDRQRDSIDLFRGLGIRYLVVHRGSYVDDAVGDAMLAALGSEGAPVIEKRTFGTVTVAVLTPLESPTAPAGLSVVPPPSIHAKSSQSPDRLPLLFDGDRDTRWISGGRQSGDEAIELDFDRARDVRVLRLQMGLRSFGDYPRDLAIEAVEANGVRSLFRGSILPHMARAIVVDGEYPFIEIVLPANAARALRIRQVGATHLFFWSIHELQLLERL
jgi:hypothetical protein